MTYIINSVVSFDLELGSIKLSDYQLHPAYSIGPGLQPKQVSCYDVLVRQTGSWNFVTTIGWLTRSLSYLNIKLKTIYV